MQCRENDANFARLRQSESEMREGTVTLEVFNAIPDKVFYQTSSVVIGKAAALLLISELADGLGLKLELKD